MINIDTSKPITTLAQAKQILTREDLIKIGKATNRTESAVRCVLRGEINRGVCISLLLNLAEEKRKILLEKAKELVAKDA